MVNEPLHRAGRFHRFHRFHRGADAQTHPQHGQRGAPAVLGQISQALAADDSILGEQKARLCCREYGVWDDDDNDDDDEEEEEEESNSDDNISDNRVVISCYIIFRILSYKQTRVLIG